MIFESYSGTSKFINSVLDTPRVCINSSFFAYFDSRHKTTFKEL